MDFPLWLKAVIMGIVEGLTEFLPVSSTGHLMIVGKKIGFHTEVFEVVIQLGALSAVWWLYRERIFRMIPFGPKATPEGRTLAAKVTLGFMPALAVGFLAHHWIKEHLFSTFSIAWASIVGGILILLVEAMKPKVRTETLEQMSYGLALAIGIGQCLALFPGMSRSGTTIMVGLALGFSRLAATEFTFLLAIPTLTAASAYEVHKYWHDLDSSMVGLLAIGFGVSFIVAMLIVKWFVRFVQSHTFEGFAWYRIVAGAIVLAMLSNNFLNP